MKRILFAGLLLLGMGCGGTSSSWSCNWQCSTTGQSGQHTYPSGPDPTDQCALDYGQGCNSFSCSCSQ